MTTWSTTLNFGPGNAAVLTNGNLTIDRSGGGNWVACLSSAVALVSGKRHMEWTCGFHPWSGGQNPSLVMGLDDNTTSVVTNLKYPGQDAHGVGWRSNGQTYQAGGLVMPLMAPGQSYAQEVDLIAGKLWWGHKPYVSQWNDATGFSNQYLQADIATGLLGNRLTGGGNWTGGKSSVYRNSNKLHVEFRFTGTAPGTNVVAGLCNAAQDFVTNLQYPGQVTSLGVGVLGTGTTYGLGGLVLPNFALNSTLAIEVDFTASPVRAWFANSANGLWNNDVIGNQNPATGAGGVSLAAISGALVPAASWFSSGYNATLNGAGSFVIAASSGFHEWDYHADAIWWNNDVAANQNPATGAGGVSLAAVTGNKYAAHSIWSATGGQVTARYQTIHTLQIPLSAGFTDWDGAGLVPPPSGLRQSFVTVMA